MAVDHDVRGVKVPMHDLLVVVEIPQHREQGDQEPPDDLFLEVGSLLTLVFDEFGQVTALDDFHHNVEVVVFHKGLVELDDIGVLQLLVDFHLSEVVIQLLVFLLALLPELLQVEPLKCVLVDSLLREVNIPECPLPQFL